MMSGRVGYWNHVNHIFLMKIDNLVREALQKPPGQIVFLVVDFELARISLDEVEQLSYLVQKCSS